MKILCVDLSHLFRRNWEAHSEADLGKPLRETCALVASLREGFDRVAVCCDSGPSWRKTIEPRYKADRPDAGAAYYDALRRTTERLAQDGCHVFAGPPVETENQFAHDGSRPGNVALLTCRYAEGDDVIGALVAWAIGGEHDVRIVSGDKDLLALVDDERGIDVQRFDVPGAPVWHEADVIAKHEVAPRDVPAWLALGGDASDGYKAFPGWEEPNPEHPDKPLRKNGIAAKTAAMLLARFGTFAGIFEALDKTNPDGTPVIKPHVASVLRRYGISAAETGLRLATLRTDLPIDFSSLLEERASTPITTERRFPKEERATEPEAPRANGATSTALAKVEPVALAPYSLEPRDLGELETLALVAFNSRSYGLANMEQAMMCMLEARERGIPVGTALRSAYNVKGKLAWSASYLAGLVLASGKAEYFEITESTDMHAVLSYKRTGRPAGTFEFTIEEAKRAGWLKSGERGDGKWITNPRTMLRWAAIRECARMAFPDVVSGMYTPDELRDGQVTDAEWERVEPEGP